MGDTIVVEPDIDFLRRPQRLYIGGEFVTTAGRLPTINPATGEVLAEAPLATEREVDDAVGAARNAFPSWRAVTPTQRARLLWGLADRLERFLVEAAEPLSFCKRPAS